MAVRKNRSQFKWGGTHPFFHHPILSAFTPLDLVGKKILDVGCGKGINGFLMRSTRDLNGSTMIGLDINQEYLDQCKHFNIYDKLIKHRLPTLPFEDKSIDFIFCTEVIEHLTRKQGEILLKEIDRICRGRAIVSTPNVWFETVKNETEDAHHSIWNSNDFKRLGYKVYGLGIKMPLLTGDPLIRLKQAMYYFFTPISYVIPSAGGFLICTKDY